MKRLSTVKNLAVVGIAAAALTLSACGSDSGSNGGDDAPVNLAFVAPFTGDASSYGVELKKGIDLAVKVINENGGIDGRDVKVTEFDDKCDPTAAATAANTVVSGDFTAVVGSVCSGGVQAGLPIYKRVDMPIVGALTSSPALAEENYDGFTRIIPSDDLLVSDAVRLTVDVLGYENLGLLYPSDDYGQSLRKVVEDSVKTYGGKIAASETYVVGQTNDYSAVLSNIASSGADVFFMGGYYSDMGTAVNQSRRAFGGKDLGLVSTSNVQVPEFISLAGAAGEGTAIATLYDVSDPREVNQNFVKAFKDEFGTEPGMQAAVGWDNIHIIKAAIEKDGGSTENLAKTLRGITFEGVTGVIEFDDRGDNVAGVRNVLRLTDGVWVRDNEASDKMAQD